MKTKNFRIPVPREDLEFCLCPMLVTRQKISFTISYRAFNYSIYKGGLNSLNQPINIVKQTNQPKQKTNSKLGIITNLKYSRCYCFCNFFKV